MVSDSITTTWSWRIVTFCRIAFVEKTWSGIREKIWRVSQWDQHYSAVWRLTALPSKWSETDPAKDRKADPKWGTNSSVESPKMCSGSCKNIYRKLTLYWPFGHHIDTQKCMLKNTGTEFPFLRIKINYKWNELLQIQIYYFTHNCLNFVTGSVRKTFLKKLLYLISWKSTFSPYYMKCFWDGLVENYFLTIYKQTYSLLGETNLKILQPFFDLCFSDVWGAVPMPKNASKTLSL